MTSAPGLATRLARLLAEIAVDAAALDARAEELRALETLWSSGSAASRTDLLVAGVNLHAWYTALETLLERIARLLDESLPTGSAWHAELVSQMTIEVPGLRPAVLDSALAGDLSELRRFRHFFRNAYVLDFEAARVTDLVARLLRVQGPVMAGVVRLRAHVGALLDEIARA